MKQSSARRFLHETSKRRLDLILIGNTHTLSLSLPPSLLRMTLLPHAVPTAAESSGRYTTPTYKALRSSLNEIVAAIEGVVKISQAASFWRRVGLQNCSLQVDFVQSNVS